MFKITILLTMLRLSHEIATLRACTPNTQFILNGRLCFCNNIGLMSEANCKTIGRRQSCQPGQIIWQGCNQCICQENGYLLCSNSHCTDESRRPPVLRHGLSTYGSRCTPYRYYYINCSICVCPASGITVEAKCVLDISCNWQNNSMDAGSENKISCIPNVMYLAPCWQCLCPDRGYFGAENCIEKCKHTITLNPLAKRCNAGTLYRKECNICRCPDNSLVDNSLCFKAICKNLSLHALRTNNYQCIPHSFTEPKCMYCDCSSKGIVDENTCLEIDCTTIHQLGKQSVGKVTCQPGEMVPICTECFCPRNGQVIPKYCSRLCSYQNRLNILEIVLKDTLDFDAIEKSKLERLKENDNCLPKSLYLDNGRYCLCPENGITDFKLCTSIIEENKQQANNDILSNNIEIDYNSSCEPNTLVEFDCNTCYCNKNGKIDPKWCTYDDCQAKRLVQESHKIHNSVTEKDLPGTCQPGTITKLKCNFCICPESGILKEKACTQNDCKEFDDSVYIDKLTCEPLEYYEVDCKICYCPRDGIKNVAKCTKNHCERNVLRSDSCTPGQLHSDGCNLCVCPPDGDKRGKACTNHVCSGAVPGKLLQLYEYDDTLDNHDTINRTKSLDQCFPGEEFMDGCKLCICTELGLKMYATCEMILCDENIRKNIHEATTKVVDKVVDTRSRRHVEDCDKVNITVSAERKECTPGTAYIIRCQECICPYFGNINNFCRPLPKNVHCEQAFPYFNYLPMGRRNIDDVTENTAKKVNKETSGNSSTISFESKNDTNIRIKHDIHTEFKCDRPGTIVDKCFICTCEEDNIVIEEHCFKSDAVSCKNAKPSFLSEDQVDL